MSLAQSVAFNSSGRLRASDWRVTSGVPLSECRDFVKTHHYARSSSKTAVYTFGLHHVSFPTFLCGVLLFLPPTRVAAESVDPDRWRQVLSLSRMAVRPGVVKNACTFMLGAAVRHIRRDGRFVALVTYADESQGHEGGVYRAAGWEYVGRTGPYTRWVDPTTGAQVASQATTTRTKAEMLALGYRIDGKFFKHKFVRRITREFCPKRCV